jgi:hypothetical protein
MLRQALENLERLKALDGQQVKDLLILVPFILMWFFALVY